MKGVSTIPVRLLDFVVFVAVVMAMVGIASYFFTTSGTVAESSLNELSKFDAAHTMAKCLSQGGDFIDLAYIDGLKDKGNTVQDTCGIEKPELLVAVYDMSDPAKKWVLTAQEPDKGSSVSVWIPIRYSWDNVHMGRIDVYAW